MFDLLSLENMYAKDQQDLATRELLGIARKNFGEPGFRNFSWLDRTFYLYISKPVWCTKEDELFATFQHKKQLLADGIVVWAHIVQANSLLFERGNDNCPASVLFAPDVATDIDPREIGSVARTLFQLKGTTPEEPELKELADNITDESVRTFGLAVPDAASPNHKLFEATTFVTRKHLPNGVLTLPFFPLLVAAKAPYYNFPLPSRFWPKKLVDY